MTNVKYIYNPLNNNLKFDIYNKYNLLFLLIVCTTISLSGYFLLFYKSSSFWEGVKNYTPGFGSSEELFYFLESLSFWVFIYLVFILSKILKNKKLLLMLYINFIIYCVLTILYCYFLSFIVKKYKEAFLISIARVFIVGFIWSLIYKIHNIKLMWGVLLLFSISIYSLLWAFSIKQNSK